MAAEVQNAPPNQMSLRWLRFCLKCFTWLTSLLTLFSIILYCIATLTTSSLYRPSLGSMVGAICVMLSIGGIFALCFTALTKLIEIWAEILDTGRYKTALLEALLADPVDPVAQGKG